MALTYTPDTPLGSKCPEFSLPSVEGKKFSLADFAEAKVFVVAFICNHCPYVRAIEDRFITLSKIWPSDVQFIGICANDPSEYPEDAPAALRQRAQDKNYDFPYLVDSEQTVAKAFGAVCTPDFFVFNSNRKLAYRGRLDDSWKTPTTVRRQEMKDAIQALLSGKTVESPQNPSMGCSIKWKKE